MCWQSEKEGEKMVKLEGTSRVRDGAVVEWREEEEEDEEEFEEIVDEAPGAAAASAVVGAMERNTAEAGRDGMVSASVAGGGSEKSMGGEGGGRKVGAGGTMKVFLKYGDATKRVRVEGEPSVEEVVGRFRSKFELEEDAVPGSLFMVRKGGGVWRGGGREGGRDRDSDRCCCYCCCC